MLSVGRNRGWTGSDALIGDKFLETEIGIRGRYDVIRSVGAARRIAECGVENESASATGILDLVAAAHRRLAFTAKRNVPCETDGRTKIISDPAYRLH